MATERAYQICKRCIMDTTDTEIVFDEEGNCNHCSQYFRLSPLYGYHGEETDKKRDALIAQMKADGKGKKYDCVVGVSGGVDSSYVAYLAKQYGLRALCVHFDNGWNSKLAVKNIDNILKKLDFDYETNVVEWEEFKDLQIAFLKASVANIEIPSDHAFLAAIYGICRKYKIKYQLSGSNFATEGILPKSWGYNAKDLKHLKAIQKRFGTKKLKTYPTLGLKKEIFSTYVHKIKMIRLLNYVPYNKPQAMEVIQKELDWVYYGGKHYESIFTRFFQAYILPVKFNIDKRRAHYSTMICSNQISREEALLEMEKPTYPPDLLASDKEYVIKKLGLSEKEFEEIMNTPVKSYAEYPNDEALLKFIYRTYYRITGRNKL